MPSILRQLRHLWRPRWIALGLLLVGLYPSLSQTNPTVEVEPFIYVSKLGSSTHVDHPGSVDYWLQADWGDYGATLDESLVWDEATGIGTTTWTGIWPTNTAPLMFQTNVFSGTYQRYTNPISWTYTGAVNEGGNMVYVTNCPWVTPFWYSQTQHLHQVSHTNTAEADLGASGIVNVVTVKTNDAKIKLYTGIADDSTRPHLFRLNVRVWNTANPNNVTEYPASAIRLLTQTPNEAGDIYILRNDNVHEDVTPSIVGMADSDLKFTVTPEKLKVRFYAQAGKLAQGYDPRPTNKVADHWTSVIVGRTNEITELRIPGNWAFNRIELKVTGQISVSQTNGFSLQATPLTIISTGTAGSGSIEAQDSVTHTTLAKLNVRMLPLRNVPVGIFRVTDPNSEGTALGDTDANETIIGELNSIFLQAGVQFTDESSNFLDGQYSNGLSLSYDTQPKDGLLDLEDETEKNVITTWVNNMVNGGLLPLVLMRKWHGSYANTNMPSQIKFYRGNYFDSAWSGVFTEPSGANQSRVCAHEVGHFLGLHHWPDDNIIGDWPFPVDNGIVVEHLMRGGLPWPLDPNNVLSDPSNWVVPIPGTWLNKEAWDKVNQDAGDLFP